MTGKKTGLKVAKKNNRAGFLFLLPLIVIFIGLLGYSFYFLISNSFRDSIKKTDTELVQACQNFIEEKAENFKQQIGWSCAWLINLWARLGDGTKANHYYEELLRQSVYDNLFDLHPPLGETEGEREVFQIDGNFGSASGVAEMLISSEKGKITILPALPDSWKNGKVRGLLAAGAIEVDITWKDRKPVSVSLRSSSDQNVSLFYRNRKLAEQIELKKQEQQIINLCSC